MPPHADHRTVRLVGGPCDGLTPVIKYDQTSLLMPTNREAALGEAPPTYPHFALYRPSALYPLSAGVFVYVGDGIDGESSSGAITRM